MNKPNLFIVGAPKCGTTFLYHYLKQHPEIYFPDFKEPHFFGSDLIRKNGAYDLSLNNYKSLPNHLYVHLVFFVLLQIHL